MQQMIQFSVVSVHDAEQVQQAAERVIFQDMGLEQKAVEVTTEGDKQRRVYLTLRCSRSNTVLNADSFRNKLREREPGMSLLHMQYVQS